MSLPPEIFKAYDIRGLYGEQIDGDGAELIGRAFARVIGRLAGRPTGELGVGLGRDMRLQAPELAERYKQGMLAEGVHVIDIGRVGTEMLYWLVGSRELDGGLMCTASHNPKAYTGAKLVRRGAIALSGDAGIQEIRREIEAGMGKAPGGGTSEQINVYLKFQQAAFKFIDGDVIKPLKVVVDGGNGMAGPMVGPLLRHLKLDLVETFWRPDGEFPGHEPNPLLPENREWIIGKVIEESAELGIAWDGDADRCFFIDDGGSFVDGDFLTALLAESLLAKHPGATILYDVRASRAVADTVERLGGTALPNRVGHAFFKTRMREEDAIFGGEVSGHYYFRDFYCADSGTIPALLMLELLSTSGKRLSELLEPYRSRYFISGEINSEVDDAAGRIAAVEQHYAAQGARIGHLDGVSVDFDDWHFNVRSSNTEPLLRLCLESLVSHEDMERRRDDVLRLIPRMSLAGWDETSEHARLAREQGIACLPIPTPFAVGRINVFLIDDDPLTLIDAGPNSGRALDELERGLRGLGRRIEDLELLVVTHQHMDHLGLVDILQKRSGAEIAAIDLLVPWMAGYSEYMEAGDLFAERVMARNGIPEETRLALRSVASSFRGWGAGATATRSLRDGEDLVLRDRVLRVLHRPGHSPTDTVFHDEARRTLIAGDHLIKHISSNPLISRPPDAPLDDPELADGRARPRSLMIYLDSLRATREMQLELVLPGHGEAFDGHAALIDKRFRMHERRAANLLKLVQEAPRTAYELAYALWGNVAVTQAYLTLSEVLGHMDLLLQDGSVVEDVDDGDVVHFRAT